MIIPLPRANPASSRTTLPHYCDSSILSCSQPGDEFSGCDSLRGASWNIIKGPKVNFLANTAALDPAEFVQLSVSNAIVEVELSRFGSPYCFVFRQGLDGAKDMRRTWPSRFTPFAPLFDNPCQIIDTADLSDAAVQFARTRRRLSFVAKHSRAPNGRWEELLSTMKNILKE
jgi:hypothetical protein